VPPDLEAAWLVERYGAQAVYGRPLTVREVRQMSAAENVHDSIKGLRAAKSWAKYSQSEPRKYRIASEALRLLNVKRS